MLALVVMHVTAALAASALGFTIFRRNRRSPLRTTFFATGILIAAWNLSSAFYYLTDHLVWRTLGPSFAPVTIAAFTVLALRASLRAGLLRRVAEAASFVAGVSYALLTLAAFWLEPARTFLDSSGWNLGLTALTLVLLGGSGVSLAYGALRKWTRRRSLCLTLLIAGAVGLLGALSEVLPPDQPLKLGAVAVLLGVTITAVGIASRPDALESVALEQFLVTLSGVAGVVVGAAFVAWRAQSQPVVAATTLAVLGLVALGSYRFASRRWRKRLDEAARMAALGRATSVLAHEVRNPLTTVSGVIDILDTALRQGQDTAAEADRYLDTVRGELQRVLTLVDDCLTYARAPEPQLESVQLDALVEKVAEAAQLRFPQAQVNVDASLITGPVRGDSAQLRQVLENLVVNACQTGPAPVVQVAITQVDARQVRLTVVDDGPGLDPAHRDKVFEPFFTTKTRGGGLGLAIARDIARRHGGDLIFEPAPSRGACLVLWWPGLDEGADDV